MSRRRIAALALAFILHGCAWVLPKPSLPPPQIAGSAACTLDLAEARKAESGALLANRVGEPLTITLADREPGDRGIHVSTPIILRGTPRGGDGPVLTIAAVDGRTAPLVPVRDGSIVRLGTASAGAGAGASAAAGLTAFHLLKADTPSPNRPTTCDALVRDGDFVLLQTIDASAWIGLRSGALTALGRPGGDGAACHTARERCETDRGGSPVCVNYYACADDQNP